MFCDLLFVPQGVRKCFMACAPDPNLRRGRQWLKPCPIHGAMDANFAVDRGTGTRFCRSGRQFTSIESSHSLELIR